MSGSRDVSHFNLRLAFLTTFSALHHLSLCSQYLATMKFVRVAVTVVVATVASSFVGAADDSDNALRDLQIGLEGLQAASKDPAMLAQLMQDLQVRSGKEKREREKESRLVLPSEFENGRLVSLDPVLTLSSLIDHNHRIQK
jgi:hypothetical protein